VTRRVVITGVCGGIGSAVAEHFAGEGWLTIGLDRASSESAPAVTEFIRCDVAKLSELEAVVERLAECERVDALINNAAIPMDRALVDVTVDEWDLVMATNVRSAFVLTKGLLEPLSRVRGAIVNVASVHAVATSRGVAAYAASKGALVAFTRAASLDLAEHGIRVNAVCPGATDTTMLHEGAAGRRDSSGLEELAARTPLARIASPTEIARAVYFLSDTAASSFVTGHALVVDGGATARLSTE
jgi:NAD(P)-dependent dehydrogenase (short-subunit alcohol dehydrogenase family)